MTRHWRWQRYGRGAPAGSGARGPRALTALVALVGLLTACTTERDGGAGPTSTQPAGTTSSTMVAPPATGPDGVPTSAPPPSLDAAMIALTEIAVLEEPTSMAVRPGDDSLYVTEQVGRLRRLTPDDDDFDVARSPVVDLSDDVVAGGEQGLLGVAFSIDGRSLYLAYTGLDGRQYVDEWQVTESGSSLRVDDASRRRVFTVDDFAPNHNGGQLALGPDGFLWYSMGDGGGGGDPQGTGQDPSDLLGSLLRVDPDGGDPYAVPAGNPFAGGGGAPEVWAYGLRNPWRFSFDAETGDLWIADVGQGEIEEIDFLPAAGGLRAGANFGWSELEGDQPFEGGEAPAEAVAPLFTYELGNGRCAVVGGFVYRGEAIPALVGAYLYGDFCDGAIRGLVQQGGEVVTEAALGVSVPSLSSFGQGQDGELYALSLAGPIYRIDPAG